MGEGENKGCSRHISLQHEQPDILGLSQYGRSVWYCVYRIVFAGYFLGVFFYDLSLYKYGVKWLIYLTDWAYLTQLLSTVCLAVLSIFIFVRTGNGRSYVSVPWSMQVVWVIYNMASLSSIVVALLYWGLVYKASFVITIINITTHGVSAGYTVIDLFISGVPMKILHMVYPMAFALLYVIFTVIYWAAGGTNETGIRYIYEVVDYDKSPGLAIGYLLVAAFVVTPVLWLIMYGVYRLRLLIATSCCNKTHQSAAVSNLEMT